MASVSIQKHTTQSACAGQLNHIYRENKNYSNEDIQPELEQYNVYYGTADQARQLIHNTISMIDAKKPPKRIKADRKTCAELCVYSPREGMALEDEIRFIDEFIKECQKPENWHLIEAHIVAGAIHCDERKKYIDPLDKQEHMSRTHGQFLILPNTSKGLNMKSWLTKDRYNKINEIADKVCMRLFGFPYRDGSQRKSRGSVEKLKAESALAEAQQMQEQAQQIIAENHALESQKAALEKEIDHLHEKQAEEAEKLLGHAHKQLWGEDKGKYIMDDEEHERLTALVKNIDATPQEMKTALETERKQMQEATRQAQIQQQQTERARMQAERELKQQREKVRMQAKEEVKEAFQRTGTLPTIQQRFFNFLKKHLTKEGTWGKLKALFEQHERQTQTEIQQHVDQQIDRDFDGFEREI